MSEKLAAHGPYHRTGEPGGKGCPLASLPIKLRGKDGSPVDAFLLNPPDDATEVEMLRTIVEKLGIQWGHDDLGWWAVVFADMGTPSSQ